MKKKNGRGTRLENDFLGALPVPASAYWGINTARAAANFRVSGRRTNQRLILAYCLVKKAAAAVNRRCGLLPAARAGAIMRAADEALAGGLADQFILDRFGAGAGTSTNMNVNEVLCNRALELLGRRKGDYAYLSPNDHVNLGQSTNDTYPAAAQLAALGALALFDDEAARLAAALDARGRAFARVVKCGRTHLQDAVPVTLGREFAAYAGAVRAAAAGARAAAGGLKTLGLGGSAAGTGLNAHPRFGRLMAAELSRLTGLRLRRAPDLMLAMQSQAPLGRASSAMRDFALELGRVANDLRLLSSGPAAGLAEISLPPVQAGSSIMPGKVNPSVPEMVNMVCFQAAGCDLAVALASGAGQLELNVMMPLMAENLLESIELLTAACRHLALLCVGGIKADAARCRAYAGRSGGLAAALSPALGYQRAAGLARRALAAGRGIAGQAEAEGLLTPGLARRLDPRRLAGL